MTRARFVLSPEALEDLDQIWLYIAEDDVAAADRLEQKLREAMELLAERPEIGHLRQDLTDQPVKFWAVDAYVIAYDPGALPLQIVRVLHGSRDIRKGKLGTETEFLNYGIRSPSPISQGRPHQESLGCGLCVPS